MKEKRLGELSEQQFEGMMDFVVSEEFDQMPASEFVATLKAMDEADLPERVVVKGHVEDGEFVPHVALGAAGLRGVGRISKISKVFPKRIWDH